MSTLRIAHLAPTLLLSALVSGCMSAKHVDEAPITLMRNGDRVAEPTRATDAATTVAMEARIDGRNRRDSIAAEAYAGCAPAVCAALGRGELALGMTEAQVLAATHSTELSWTRRRSGRFSVLAPRDDEASPRDAVAPVALVQLADGGVAGFTYREPQGLRMVSTPSDVDNANRTRAVALGREGDALAAAGDFTGALERYDRASVVDPADAALQYKMATSLDKLLRPREAELRYLLFLNQLEIQKIDARGNANARLAEAMVQAREHLVVLERQRP